MPNFLLRAHRTLIATAAVALMATAGSAEAQDGRPLEYLGRAVQVRSYRVPDGAPNDFSERRKAAIAAALRDIIAARGTPLVQEEPPNVTHVRLVYRDALVIITGRYSNGIICRIEIPTAGLRGGIPAEAVTVLAARSCRAAEEAGWGASGHDQLIPIGSEALPDMAGARVSIYATENLTGLFRTLVRGAEIEGATVASLVRGDDPLDSSFQQEGWDWRYAWFGNGALLAIRYERDQRDVGGRRGMGLACTITAPAAALSKLDEGPFRTWCSRQSDRLRPGLSQFVLAVQNYRNRQQAEAGAGETSAIAAPSGFHYGALPVALTTHFWKTGEVTTSLDR